MISNFQQYNESLRDKMTPKSEKEIEEDVDKLWDELIVLGEYETYSTKELVEGFFEDKWKEIDKMIEDGATAEEIYDEFKNELIYFLEEQPEEYDDSDDKYEEWRDRNNIT